MPRYIDADAFLKSVKQKAYPQSGNVNESERKISLFGIMEILTAMPTADVVEVVHGEWIEQDDAWDGVYYECSVCKEAFTLIDGTPTDNLYNFCPNCGADMRGGRNELHKRL